MFCSICFGTKHLVKLHKGSVTPKYVFRNKTGQKAGFFNSYEYEQLRTDVFGLFVFGVLTYLFLNQTLNGIGHGPWSYTKVLTLNAH